MWDHYSDQVHGRERLAKLTAEADMDRAARQAGHKNILERLTDLLRRRRPPDQSAPD